MENLPLILVVEDDADMRELIVSYLAKSRLHSQCAGDGEQMAAALAERLPDLILLDIMLPGADGMVLCQQLRANPATAQIPIIMLTARDSVLNRVVGLELGADDYLNKPFEPMELLARIRAVLRRARPQAPPLPGMPEPPAPMLLRFGSFSLDLSQRHLLSPSNVLISLASSDFRILEHLLRHPHQAVSRDQLMDLAFGRERAASDRAVDVCISRLRGHIELDSRKPQIIRTVRHEGYMLVPPPVHGD